MERLDKKLDDILKKGEKCGDGLNDYYFDKESVIKNLKNLIKKKAEGINYPEKELTMQTFFMVMDTAHRIGQRNPKIDKKKIDLMVRETINKFNNDFIFSSSGEQVFPKYMPVNLVIEAIVKYLRR